MNIKKWFINFGDPLILYNRRTGEPEPSVMKSLDYDFAVSRYSRTDFRYEFVNAYIAYVKKFYNKFIYNCKLERPRNDAEFLNFYIYMEDPGPEIQYRIENPNHKYILAFYEVLIKCKLQGITKDMRIQFILKDIVEIMKATAVAKAWQEIHEPIEELFPECTYLCSWGRYFYVFIHTEKYEVILKDKARLEEIKKYCFEAVKRYDRDNVWKYEEYRIKVDNDKIYQEIGGGNYFNSDAMNLCRCI
ncbi:MAG: hypothetical protein ABFC98_04245 [Candidatus Cloacimonas sp.]